MITTIVLWLVALVRVATAIVLLRLAAQKNLPNLRWLAWGFLTTVVAIPFAGEPYIPYVDKAIAYFTYLFFAIFIARTFYQNRRSPLIPLWIVFTIAFIVMFWLTGQFMTEATGVNFPQHIFLARPSYDPAQGGVPMTFSETIDSVIYGSLQIAIWLWHAIAGFQAIRLIAADSKIENWVKSRYRLIILYSCLQSLVGVAMMARPFLPGLAFTLTALLVIVTTSMQYLVWIMPEWFRGWLNREQRVRSEDEQQPLSALDVFGTAMIEGTNLQSIACFYAIRAAVSKRIGSEDSAVVRAHINTMSYEEWETVLRHAELHRILMNSGADRFMADVAVENALSALVEKQSLLTFGAH